MKIRSSEIVFYSGSWQIIYSTPTRYYISTSESGLKQITNEQAWKIIAQTEKMNKPKPKTK